ncbi:DUF5994 family protein [Yinghuangia soli]|uniref:DUF5994 family protein n=1 Tax=Yinghuangia soli TaxID=2908204 RepID=UPI0027E3ADA3|nr:DUF5994 family protein [Yinghuangia soli]
MIFLRPQIAGGRPGTLDGAWWPRSRDIGAQLRGLVTALSAHIAPVSRVGLDRDAWDGVPEHLFIDRRLVHIDWFPIGDDTVLFTRDDGNLVALLVIPPHATQHQARQAMAQALDLDNLAQAEQILVDAGLDRKGGPAA